MLSALLLALSVCAVSAAPTTATRNSAAKSLAPAKPVVSKSTMVIPTINAGGVLPQGPSGGQKPLTPGDVLVVRSGTLVQDGVTYPAGTYLVDQNGKLVPLKTSARPFAK